MKIGIIGLGYVGLPLLIEFSKKFKVIGYDKNINRINSLKKNHDLNNELNKGQLKILKNCSLTSNIKILKTCNVFIVTVPTPITKLKKPDLKPLKDACTSLSSLIKKNDIIIFESTVYPGLTEDFCVPLLSLNNNLIYNKDFFCGYSPERINPGDKKNTLTNIVKITSGSNNKTANKVDKLYKSIIKAGTYKVTSIRIAEAAKIIENCQRDVNIAFINELNHLFDKLKLDTNEILKAASTKWNFLDFKPGLVGGHCVSVDPYYLINKALELNFKPNIMIAARKFNESVAHYICKNVDKHLENNISKNKKIIIYGFGFKENCSDIRNTKIFEVYKILKKTYKIVDIYDPLVSKDNVKKYYKINLINHIKKKYYNYALIAVGHDLFKKIGIERIKRILISGSHIYDYKKIF